MASPAAIQLVIYAAVVLVTGAGAVLLLVANPRRNWNQMLAFFLLLVCGNFAAQVATATLGLELEAGVLTRAEAEARNAPLLSLGFLFLALDPFVLAYFASIFPRRSGLATRPWAVAALGALVLLFLASEVLERSLSGPSGATPLRVAFFAYLGGMYAYAAGRLLASYLSEPSSVMAAQLRVVTFGVVVAAVPRVALIANETIAAWYPYGEASAILIDLALRLVVLWALFAAGARAARSRAVSDARRDEASRVAFAIGAVFLGFSLLWVVNRVASLFTMGWEGERAETALGDVFHYTEFSTFAIRWFVFSAAMLYGVVRYQILAVGERALEAGGVVVVAGAGVLVVGEAGTRLGPWAGAAIAGAVILAAGASYVARRRSRAEARSLDYLHERSLEVYRALLAAALADRDRHPGKDRDLAAARARLGVTEREHATLLALAEAEEARPDPRSRVAGRYEVVRKLGAGGYATVFLARDTREGTLVVLKRIAADRAGSTAAADAAFRELEVARRLSHPHVVAIHDVVRVHDGAVVVMEFAEGGSLWGLLDRARRLPDARAIEIARELLSALAALHEARLVHGDVKPENVLLTAEGRVRLADFGVARPAGTRRTAVHGSRGAAPGTLLYMAPEQLSGKPPTPASDLYAVGALVHEMVTGATHIADDGKGPFAVMRRIVEGWRDERRLVPPPWRTFLARALAADPSHRFASAAEASDALLEVEREVAATPRPRRAGVEA